MDIKTPVGRIVQGSVAMQHQKDMETNQPKFNADGSPEMATFIALAFPKTLPNGQPNAEFNAFHAQLGQIAAASWPALFPQGYNPALPNGGCMNPRFSWKIQDGDGVDHNGRSVADKPGFKGHWIVKFYTAYPLRCFHEGKFAPHEEIQKPEDIIKRGYWVRLFGEAKTNNASGTQVPGISLYPKLLSFVERGEEISSGPDAQSAFGDAPIGWRPPATSSPIPSPAAALPPPPALAVPVPPAPVAPPVPVPVAPQYAVNPALAAQGVTVEGLLAQGWTHEAAITAGHIIKL